MQESLSRAFSWNETTLSNLSPDTLSITILYLSRCFVKAKKKKEKRKSRVDDIFIENIMKRTNIWSKYLIEKVNRVKASN